LTRLLSRFLLSLRSAESAPIDGSQVKRMLDFLIPSERGNSPVGKSPTFRAITGKRRRGNLKLKHKNWNEASVGSDFDIGL